MIGDEGEESNGFQSDEPNARITIYIEVGEMMREV